MVRPIDGVNFNVADRTKPHGENRVPDNLATPGTGHKSSARIARERQEVPRSTSRQTTGQHQTAMRENRTAGSRGRPATQQATNANRSRPRPWPRPALEVDGEERGKEEVLGESIILTQSYPRLTLEWAHVAPTPLKPPPMLR